MISLAPIFAMNFMVVCGSHNIPADTWICRVEHQEVYWWALMHGPFLAMVTQNETPFLLPMQHKVSYLAHIPHHASFLDTSFPSVQLKNTPAPFKWNYTGTCIQHPDESGWVSLHTFLLHLHLLLYLQYLLPLPLFHMSEYHGSPRDCNLWGHVIEHSTSILHAPTFCIHVNKATTHNSFQ